MSGANISVNDAINKLWLELQSGLVLTFMNVTMTAAPYLHVDGNGRAKKDPQEVQFSVSTFKTKRYTTYRK